MTASAYATFSGVALLAGGTLLLWFLSRRTVSGEERVCGEVAANVYAFLVLGLWIVGIALVTRGLGG